jgi:hypothetical protein
VFAVKLKTCLAISYTQAVQPDEASTTTRFAVPAFVGLIRERDMSAEAPVDRQKGHVSQAAPASQASDRTSTPAELSTPAQSAEQARRLRKNLDKQKKDNEYAGRYEVKYVIPRRLVPRIREFIKPFCELDSNCVGDPPGYIITTLQLDSPNLSLHYAKLWDFLDRFKLRVRVYGDPVGTSPVFIEVKAKYRTTVVKYRSHIPFDKWGKHLFGNEIIRGVNFKSSTEAENFYQFVRLVKEIGARPVVLIRYRRESYFGKNDHYSRLTLDTRLQYQRTTSWDSWGRGGQWFSLDKPMDQTRRHDKESDFSGVVLELKSLHDVPLWIINLVQDLNLDRQGHCKYSNSIWAESIFCNTPWTPEYEIDLLQYL